MGRCFFVTIPILDRTLLKKGITETVFFTQNMGLCGLKVAAVLQNQRIGGTLIWDTKGPKTAENTGKNAAENLSSTDPIHLP
jgi:hypothetical protein